SAGELAWDCLVVPESKELGELLREFQREHQQMAIIIDEYGGTAGLVTLEDVLEEIVGEIRDEHEAGEPPEWRALADDRYRLQGRAPLEVLEELFGVTVDDDEVDTVGGLVFARYGTVPEPGAVVTEEGLGLVFTVEEVEGRRITSLVVERMGRGEEGDDV
ncbi:MAG TPA: CBS domain-containing protein, partial [Acidobacteria bacterium]|nr:CBS domain-containing protein [Acidobacteriota bacterium]